MEIYKQKFIFSKQASTHLDVDTLSLFSELSKKWHLYNWEDALLYQIFPLNPLEKVGDADLRSADELVATLRGEDGTKPFSVSEIEALVLDSKFFTENNVKRLVRTTYYCLSMADIKLAVSVRVFLDPVFFEDNKNLLSTIQTDLVNRLYTILCAYYFNELPKELAYFLFESDFFLLAIKLGFDWEEIIAKFNSLEIVFNKRMNFCIEMAASLAENDSLLGKDLNGNEKNIKYWLDNFRIYSKNNFDGTSLINFVSDKNYTEKCSSFDKEIISQTLQIYTHLINGFLAVPEGDLAAVDQMAKMLQDKNLSDEFFGYFKLKEKNNNLNEISEEPSNNMNKTAEILKPIQLSVADVRALVMAEFGFTPNDQYDDVESVLHRLAEMSNDFKDPKIAEMYYFDEKTGEFKWDL